MKARELSKEGLKKLKRGTRMKHKENKYEKLKDKQQKEFDAFPMRFAFDDKQFEEGMKELGLSVKDTDKIVSIGYGGFIRKSDIKAFNEMNKRHRVEEKEAMDKDLTGEGYIKDMFDFELANHEYGYTYELDDTLDALGLTIEEINNDERLKHGLKLALDEYKEIEEDEEYEEYEEE